MGRHKIDSVQKKKLVPVYLKEMEIQALGGMTKCVDFILSACVSELVRLQLEKEKAGI